MSPSRSRSFVGSSALSPKRRISESRLLRPTSRPGTSASCRTAPAFRPAAARRRRALASTRRNAPMCHGENGKGGTNAALVGGEPIKRHRGGEDHRQLLALRHDALRLTFAAPCRGGKPRSLTNDEVYALTAYILSLNKLIGENDTMNAQTLPKVRMPNRDGFIVRFPDKM